MHQVCLVKTGGEKRPSKMLGGSSQGLQLSIYVPSKDKAGEPVDHAHWKKTTMAFMTRVFAWDAEKNALLRAWGL
jgi:hypothetical protein